MSFCALPASEGAKGTSPVTVSYKQTKVRMQVKIVSSMILNVTSRLYI